MQTAHTHTHTHMEMLKEFSYFILTLLLHVTRLLTQKLFTCTHVCTTCTLKVQQTGFDVEECTCN